MHEYASFIAPALIAAALLAGIAFLIERRVRRAYRLAVSNNLARAVERTDRKPRHVGPRADYFGHRDGDRYTRANRHRHHDGATLGTV